MMSLNSESTTIKQVRESINKFDLNLEKFTYDTNSASSKEVFGLYPGTLIEKVCCELKKNPKFSSTTFHVLIDEFETLSIDQQVQINTLIKQSNRDLVYDISVKTKGILSYETLSGQLLEKKDDYKIYSTDRYGYYEGKEYKNLLSEICKKRLEKNFELSEIQIEEKYLEIDFYLKKYTPIEEEKHSSFSDENISDLQDRLTKAVQLRARKYNLHPDKIEDVIQVLGDCSPIRVRMHIALLYRDKTNSVNPEELSKHFLESTKKYKDWEHNIYRAAQYLLCSEYNRNKPYHSFDEYARLSSGVVRSFLELLEYAFSYAFENKDKPFTFEKPRPFTLKEQTRAVYFLSEFKLKEIESYKPYGYRLKDFTKGIGKIFKNISITHVQLWARRSRTILVLLYQT